MSGTTVRLRAAAEDSDGVANLTFRWSLLTGPLEANVVIVDATRAEMSFVAPRVSGAYTFRVEVQDRDDNTESDQVTIQIECPETDVQCSAVCDLCDVNAACDPAAQPPCRCNEGFSGDGQNCESAPLLLVRSAGGGGVRIDVGDAMQVACEAGAGANGLGSPTGCEVNVPPGSRVVLTALPTVAEPAERSARFEEWSGACDGTTATCIIESVTFDRTVDVKFAWPLILAPLDGGNLLLTDVDEGESVLVTPETGAQTRYFEHGTVVDAAGLPSAEDAVSVLWSGCPIANAAASEACRFSVETGVELSMVFGIEEIGGFDLFGGAVAIGGDTFVVGAVGEGASGAAYVFRRRGDGWVPEQRLRASDGALQDEFGSSVGVSGQLIVVGAPGDDTPRDAAGSAYIFARSGGVWTESQQLQGEVVPPETVDDRAGDAFGSSVAISGEVAVVGAPGHNFNWGNTHVFVRNGLNWNVERRIDTVLSGLCCNDLFGTSVAIDRDVLAVGTDARFNGGNSAFFFDRSNGSWLEREEFEGTTIVDDFGRSVGVSDGSVVVGVPGGLGGTDAGKAVVYVSANLGWIKLQDIVADDVSSSDLFGKAVAISGGTLVIGAPEQANGRGAAYVYRRNGSTWSLDQKLEASDGEQADRFGSSVGVFGDVAIVGAPEDDHEVFNTDGGSVYVFTRDTETWSLRQKFRATVPADS